MGYYIKSSELTEMITKYNSGISLNALSLEYHYTYTKVRWGLLHAGVKFRPAITPKGLDKRRFYLDDNYFDCINTEEKAYWLGFTASDGCIDDKGVTLRLTFGLESKDIGHLEKLLKSLNSDYPIHSYIRPNGQRYSEVALSSNHLCQSLMKIGIVPRKSKILEPWIGDNSLMRHYWRGMIDGDGSLGIYSNLPNIALCGTEKIIDSYNQFVDSNITIVDLRHKKSITHATKQRLPGDNLYMSSYNGNNAHNIMSFLYLNSIISLDRKRQIVNAVLGV